VDAAALPVAAAVDALEAALAAGFDPEGDPARVPAGDFLLMPSRVGAYAGVKVLSVAPENPSRALPRIQGVFVLWDAVSLTPVAAMDGAALTTLRTPAVSAVAARALMSGSAPLRLVVFGRGPQGVAHTAALREVVEVQAVTTFGSDAAAADVAAAVREADVICCCTSARAPLFDGALVRDDAVVIAVGSHSPDARELDSALMGRATVVVESRASALREAGDVIQAVNQGALDPEGLLTLAALVRGDAALAAGRPRVFKSVGMSWEDVVTAAAAYDRTPRTGRGSGE
jgi:ornithine cyclodeaminase